MATNLMLVLSNVKPGREVDGDSPGDLERAYEQFRWQRRERAEAVAAGRDPVVSVSETLDPDQFLVGFFSARTDKVPSVHVSAGEQS